MDISSLLISDQFPIDISNLSIDNDKYNSILEWIESKIIEYDVLFTESKNNFASIVNTTPIDFNNPDKSIHLRILTNLKTNLHNIANMHLTNIRMLKYEANSIRTKISNSIE